MNNQYQPHPVQHSQPQTMQAMPTSNANGQSIAYNNHQYLSPQAQAPMYTSSSSTTTTTTSQQYTAAPNHQYAHGTYPSPNQQLTFSGSLSTNQSQHMQPQQPSPNLSLSHNSVNMAYLQPSPSGPHYTAQSQYVQQQQQQPSMTPQPQMLHQQAVHQLQSQDTVMSPQPLMSPSTHQLSTSVGTPIAQPTQQQVLSSGTQYLAQTQNSAQQQQQQMYQQPQISQQPPIFQQSLLNSPAMLQQPQQQSSVNFTQLLQSTPQPQQAAGSNFSQLMQAAPMANTSFNAVNTTTTITRTETYKGANAGGEARKKAEAKGEEEVSRFETQVQKLIKSVGTCPLWAPWYNMVQGYVCAEGIHFLYHKDIDKAFKQPGWIPRVTWVNTMNDPEAQASGTYHVIHPPPVDFHQPMHRVHRDFMKVAPRIGVLVLRGDASKDLRKRGCGDDCLKGFETMDAKESDRHLRKFGYDPNASRHAMFRDH